MKNHLTSDWNGTYTSTRTVTWANITKVTAADLNQPVEILKSILPLNILFS